MYFNSVFFENFQKSRKMASSEQRTHQFTRRKIKGKLNGNKGESKENTGKLKDKQGTFMENKRKWTGNKGKLGGNKGKLRGHVFEFLFFLKCPKIQENGQFWTENSSIYKKENWRKIKGK